jgi:outer membrane lipoprotein carrier protein
MRIVAILISLTWSLAYADTVTINDALRVKLNAMHTMSASFKQIVKSRQRTIASSNGSMALSRPGKFRWQTKHPMQQLVIADGKHLWVYDVDLEQVSVKKQDKGLGGTAALFLSGYNDNITQDFIINANHEGTIFDLVAKSKKENFQRVKLSFNGDQLDGLELFDQLGQHTFVHLSNVKLNPKLNETLFQFKTPKGVDVVEQ